MYQKIQDDLLKMVKSKNDYRLLERRPNIGQALKQYMDKYRIPMHRFVKEHGLNRNYLNNLIRTGEVNTSSDHFTRIIKALGVSSDEFIRTARETAQYNFYHKKSPEAPRFAYSTYEVEVFSPPCFSAKDFLWCLIRIQPGKKIHNLIHGTMDQVAAFVTHGHLGLKYGEKTYSIHTNQCFFLDPRIKHSFINEMQTSTTEFYLLYHPKEELSLKRDASQNIQNASTTISVASLTEQIRKELSPNPNLLLPMPMLAHLSGIPLPALIHLIYKSTKIIPFEKIDRLAALTDYTFDNILQKSENRYQGWFNVFTDQDKASISLSFKYGVGLLAHTGIGTGKRKFTIADMVFDSWKEGDLKKHWTYQGIGFMGISVQRGRIGIQYGSQPAKILGWGEHLYLNTDVEITLSNILSEEQARACGESAEAKATIFTFPPII